MSAAPSSPPKIQPREARHHNLFVIVLVAVAAGLFLAVIWPILQALFIGAILSGLCYPLFRTLAKFFGGRRSLASMATLLILFLLIVGPLSALSGLVVKQAMIISEYAIPWFQERFASSSLQGLRDWVTIHFPWTSEFIPTQEDIVKTIGTGAQAAGGYLVSGISAFTATTATFLLNFFVMFYAMFFFLRDGSKILNKTMSYIPLGPEEKSIMLERFTSITRATIKGTFLIGLLQGSLAGLGFYFAGIEAAVFWGVVMVILSVVPGIGSALVWGPAVIYLFVTGQTLTGTLLLIWCAGVVSTIDNLLRPRLVGQDARMPDLLILVGTLGGLFLFGPLGVVIGPIVCGVFLTTLDIYASAFRYALAPSAYQETQPPEAATPHRRRRKRPAQRAKSE